LLSFSHNGSNVKYKKQPQIPEPHSPPPPSLSAAPLGPWLPLRLLDFPRRSLAQACGSLRAAISGLQNPAGPAPGPGRWAGFGCRAPPPRPHPHPHPNWTASPSKPRAAGWGRPPRALWGVPRFSNFGAERLGRRRLCPRCPFPTPIRWLTARSPQSWPVHPAASARGGSGSGGGGGGDRAVPFQDGKLRHGAVCDLSGHPSPKKQGMVLGGMRTRDPLSSGR
jgi:hypothetical protein